MRHVCGTCRFFQATATNAKTGWCSHPEKQTTTDVRILVRAGELYCRNDWDHSLWQPAESGDLVLQVTMTNAIPAPERPAKPPVPPTIDIAASANPVQSERTIRPLSGEMPIRPAAHAEDDIDEARLVSEDLNRELLRKAREQYRLRRKSPRLEESPAVDRPIRTIADPIIISNDVHTQVLGAARPKSLLGESRASDSLQPLTERAAPPEDLTLDGPVSMEPDQPPVERQPVERADEARRDHERGGRWSLRRSADRRTETNPLYETLDDGEKAAAPVGAERDPVPAGDSLDVDHILRGDYGDDTWADFVEPVVDEAWAVEEARRGRDLGRRGQSVWQAHDNDDGAIEAEPQLPASEPRRPPDRHADRDLEELAPWAESPRRRARMPALDPVEETAPSAAASPLWANVPRCCANCRDFRPAESGERGWCTNKWAFKHRRMVDMDDVACETTIGAWWLPRDDVWQDEYDVAAHGQATPLMDRWLGRRGSEPQREPGLETYRARRHS